jgi:hypothetical protein
MQNSDKCHPFYHFANMEHVMLPVLEDYDRNGSPHLKIDLYARLVYVKAWLGGAGFDPAERTAQRAVDPLNLIQIILAEGNT